MNTTTAYSTKDEYTAEMGDIFHKKGDTTRLYIIVGIDVGSYFTSIHFTCLNDNSTYIMDFNTLKRKYTIYRNVAISIEGDEV